MSSTFKLGCATCEVEGPILHRGAGGAVSFIDPDVGYSTTHQTPEENALAREAGRAVWEQFLIKHEYHEMVILNEGEAIARRTDKPMDAREFMEWLGPEGRRRLSEESATRTAPPTFDLTAHLPTD